VVAIFGLPIFAFLLPWGWFIALVWPLFPVALVLELFGLPVLSGPYQSGRFPLEKFKGERRPHGHSRPNAPLWARVAAPVMILVGSGVVMVVVGFLRLH